MIRPMVVAAAAVANIFGRGIIDKELYPWKEHEHTATAGWSESESRWSDGCCLGQDHIRADTETIRKKGGGKGKKGKLFPRTIYSSCGEVTITDTEPIEAALVVVELFKRHKA